MPYSPLDNFEIQDNALCISGKSITELDESGMKPPCFFYSKQVITRKIKMLRESLPKKIKIHYSIKANPLPALVSFITDYVDGLEVSSMAEMKTALATGMNSANICLTGPGKSYEELEIAVKNGIVISAESVLELHRLDEIGTEIMHKPSVLIRVNPTYTQKRAGMKMASGSSQFGIDAELVPELLNWVKDSCINLHGFHVYSGSQILDADAINYSQNKTVELIKKFSSEYGKAIKTINMGGGFGIPYFSKHTPLDLNSIGNNMESLLHTIESFNPKHSVNAIVELGRYVVGECGIYVCKVVDKKISRGKIYLITNGGMHHHLAASGNLGQKNRKNFPVHIANKINSSSKEVVNIVGKLCTPLDLLGDGLELSKAEVGDNIAIMQSGAYGYSASPINFLSQPKANEYLI